MPHIPDKCLLLCGPYRAPALHVGDRAECLQRGTVVITSWTDALVSWPRCKPREDRCRPSLLLDGELARAVRTEAAAAVCYWWGLSHGVVNRWRKFLDVDRVNNPGTHKLVKASAQAGAEVIKSKVWTDAEREAKREQTKRLNLARHLRPGYHGRWWTEEEMDLLGKFLDDEVAKRTGRTVKAVRVKRGRVGLATDRAGGTASVKA
jgi:hypothetical protein